MPVRAANYTARRRHFQQRTGKQSKTIRSGRVYFGGMEKFFPDRNQNNFRAAAYTAYAYGIFFANQTICASRVALHDGTTRKRSILIVREEKWRSEREEKRGTTRILPILRSSDLLWEEEVWRGLTLRNLLWRPWTFGRER